MTVGELIAALQAFDPSLTVYCPGDDRKAEIVAVVQRMPHVHTEELGVRIPDDVCLMSQEFADLLAPPEQGRV